VEDSLLPVEDYRKLFVKNLKDGIQIYQKLEKRAFWYTLISIVLSITHVVLSLMVISIPWLILAACGLIGFALSAYQGCNDIENILFLGHLVVLNKEFTPKRVMVARWRRSDDGQPIGNEYIGDEDHRRMVWQQFEEPGFKMPEAS